MASPGLLTAQSVRIKQARRLATRAFRRKTGRFLVEGPQAVREALEHRELVLEVYAEPDVATRHRDLRDLASAADVPWYDVNRAAVEALSETVTSQGVVAVCQLVDVPLDQAVLRTASLVAVGVQVRDPGNAGTLIRTADAAGADAVVLSAESVDPHNPKAVRASVGSLFHLPIAVEADVVTAAKSWREQGLQVLAADGYGSSDLDECIDDGTLAKPTVWLFGNEAHGLPDGFDAIVDRSVKVPIYGRAESLNLATAAAVCLYASARAQRRTG
ncbi:TrmH family RNA methyltransferase [Kribbella orskensis]|uniref:TrmH family RNA methyltransferase n=1 Tax=Kribbella orskensis TaxID=2512216 RepID=A0ABY2B7L0_9ACTN|nr:MULTISPECIES: RNA methyltransferase [Kribbella]TCN30474.1 TrmH family RNA methyltransferase [Kribbella sp. VKM Ac-2500]TCO11116.1 TrmH family RNA methyltransferase [Kribbella orskensis]